jgi:hypothetical protein
VTPLRPALQAVVEALLAASEDSRQLSIDDVGEALGTEVATGADVEAIFDALEAAGRTLLSPQDGQLKERLRAVLEAARSIGAARGRRATVPEIAAATGLGEDRVRHALAFGRILGR